MTKTLADMTADERQACVGMWCDNRVSTAEEPALVVLSCVQGEFCWIVHTNLHGERSGFTLDSVSPRFDLLRAWNPDGTPVEKQAHAKLRVEVEKLRDQKRSLSKTQYQIAQDLKNGVFDETFGNVPETHPIEAWEMGARSNQRTATALTRILERNNV